MKKSPVHSIKILKANLNTILAIVVIITIIPVFTGCDYLFPPLNGDKITPEDADKYINKHKDDPDLVILDIRPKNEFDSVKIDNSVNLDYSMPDFPEMTDKLDRNKRYIIVDKNGKRGPLAFELMREQKFLKVHYIIGGIEEWVRLSFPVK